MQPRDSGRWWADQHGTEWSTYAVWQSASSDTIRLVMSDERNDVRVYRRDGDDDLLHLVTIPPPEATEAEKKRFYAERIPDDDPLA